MITTPADISIKAILVPVDGSEASFRAAAYAIRIAKHVKAKVICVHAIAIPPYLFDEQRSGQPTTAAYYVIAKKQAENWFSKVFDLAAREGVDVRSDVMIDVLSVSDAIVSYAIDAKADMIVMGTRGKTPVGRFPIGSVATAVVTHASCPVLVVR